MKQTHDNTWEWKFTDSSGKLVAAYFPDNPINDQKLWENLANVPFTRVHYISRFNKPNRTPRLTWSYGQIKSDAPNPNLDSSNPIDQATKLRTIPNYDFYNKRNIVNYRGLDFESEMMPLWLEELSQYCRLLSIKNFGFDPQYNSVIIGKYEDGNDQIGFHTDDETFLAHHFCANVTLGVPRDFQFKIPQADGTKQTHEITLGHKSVFFFLGLEHALPARKRTPPGQIRYSISFRNMANNIGIGNSFYYCRGLAGAIDNQNKKEYQEKLSALQNNK